MSNFPMKSKQEAARPQVVEERQQAPPVTEPQNNGIAESKFTTPFSRAAIVAPDDLTFGLFRVHDVEREVSLVEQIVFRTKREALVWLRLGIL